MSLKTEAWQRFRYSEIFVIRKGFYNKKPEHTVDGDIPFLGATDSHNGVTDYYSVVDIEASSKTGDDNNAPLTEKLFPPKALCVTNNGSVGYAYYQPVEFTCSHDVNPLYLKDGEFTLYTALFISTVIAADRYRWAYGRKWRPARMVDSEIFLPATPAGQPDWDFMEKYMKSLEQPYIDFKPPSVEISAQLSDIATWREFALNELYLVEMGNKFDLSKMTQEEPSVNFVSRISFDNGVVGAVDRLEEVGPYPAGKITVSLGGSYLGSFFVQDEPFYTGQNVAVLTPKFREMNIFTHLFVATLVRKEARTKFYAFGRELNTHINESFSIRLPADETGSPNWNAIDSYMQNFPYSDRINYGSIEEIMV